MNSQEFYAAVTVYHEARGESIDGQAAVAHVIFNRALIRQLSVKEIVYQPKQFSCFNETKRPPITDYQAFVIAQEAVAMAREERMRGLNLYGADHYYATYIDQPSWAENMKRVAVIGQHIFYRA